MKVLSIIAFLCCIPNLLAQQVWGLDDCIEHALNNNLSLKQQELNLELNDIQVNQSYTNLAPSWNANTSVSQNRGRSINLVTYDFVEEVNKSFSISTQVNMTLFSGFKNWIQIKKSANELQKSIYDLESSKNDLISSIALNYLQILFNKELYQAAKQQYELSKAQESRIQLLVDVGSLARGELLNIQSQLALEEQQLVQSENQLNLSKLQLAQILEFQDFQALDIKYLDIEVPTFQLKESIDKDFVIALEKQYAIKSAESAIRSAEYDHKNNIANFFPTLSAGFSTGTNYNDYNDIYSFKEQFDNNANSNISVSLNIPLFNKFYNHISLQQSKIQIENAHLNAQQAKNQLRKNMEQAYADQLAAYKRFIASQKAVIANSESFSYIKDRYELGMVNSYEFNESKNNLIKAESDELQAKYDLIFKVKLYEFYTSLTFEL